MINVSSSIEPATEWKAAAGTVDISPAQPLPMAGYGKRPEPFTGIEAPLEANAIAFRLDASRCAVIVTLDALFVGPAVQRALTKHFLRVHNQRADDLLVLASHTHFAPAIDDTKPMLGVANAEHVAFVIRRCQELIDKVVATTGAPVEVARFRGVSTAGINRRRRWFLPYAAGARRIGFGTVMAPNPDGPFNPEIGVWVVANAGGRPMALLWHYTCHPTGFPRAHQASPEFPGIVRDRLRRRYKAALPVLFLQGFAGDIRPRVPERRSPSRRRMRSLVYGPGFDGFSPEGWRQWAEAFSDDVERALDDGPVARLETAPSIRSASKDIPLARIVAGGSEHRPVHFQRLQLGGVIDIVAVAAEPLIGLRDFVPFPGATTVGYLGDVFGYWPTDREAFYGGYEVRHFLRSFGLKGPLKKRLDGVFRSAIDALDAPQ